MAFAGKSDKKENVTAAIAANIWMSHERGGRTALPDETLNFIVLDCLVSVLPASPIMLFSVDPLHFGHSYNIPLQCCCCKRYSVNAVVSWEKHKLWIQPISVLAYHKIVYFFFNGICYVHRPRCIHVQ